MVHGRGGRGGHGCWLPRHHQGGASRGPTTGTDDEPRGWPAPGACSCCSWGREESHGGLEERGDQRNLGGVAPTTPWGPLGDQGGHVSGWCRGLGWGGGPIVTVPRSSLLIVGRPPPPDAIPLWKHLLPVRGPGKHSLLLPLLGGLREEPGPQQHLVGECRQNTQGEHRDQGERPVHGCRRLGRAQGGRGGGTSQVRSGARAVPPRATPAVARGSGDTQPQSGGSCSSSCGGGGVLEVALPPTAPWSSAVAARRPRENSQRRKRHGGRPATASGALPAGLRGADTTGPVHWTVPCRHHCQRAAAHDVECRCGRVL